MMWWCAWLACHISVRGRGNNYAVINSENSKIFVTEYGLVLWWAWLSYICVCNILVIYPRIYDKDITHADIWQPSPSQHKTIFSHKYFRVLRIYDSIIIPSSTHRYMTSQPSTPPHHNQSHKTKKPFNLWEHNSSSQIRYRSATRL